MSCKSIDQACGWHLVKCNCFDQSYYMRHLKWLYCITVCKALCYCPFFHELDTCLVLQSRSKGLRHFPENDIFISYLFINTIFANPFPPKQCCGLGFLISGLSASRIKQLCNGGVRGWSKKIIKMQRSENYSLDVQKNALSQRVLTGIVC